MSTTTTDLELRIRTALEGIEKVTGFRVELSKTGETAAGLTDSARKLDTALEGLADLQQQIDSYRTLEARLNEVATALEAARDKQRGLSNEIAASLGPSQRQLAEQAKANAEVARAESLLERVRETQRALSAEVAASLGPSKQQLAEQQRANEAVSQAAALLAQAREQQRALSAEVAASLGPSKQQTAEKANATAAVVKLEAQLNKAREQQRDYTQQVIAAEAPNGRLLQKQAESTSRLEALERKLQLAKQRQQEANAAVEAGSEPNAELTRKHEAATAQLESLGKALNEAKQRQQEANAAVAAGSEPSAALIKRHETATARLEAMERALIMARQRQTEANAAVAAGSEPTQQQIKNHERATDEVEALSAQLKHLQGELQREAAALAAAGVQTNQLNAATQRISDTFAEVQAKAKAFADAQANLKLIPHEQLKREAQALKDSYAVLQSSGKLTAQELAQANLRLREGLIELERRTNGWKDALLSAKFEIGAAIAAFAPIAYSIKQASDFETALAGVRKVVDGSDEQFASLTGRIRELAKELPISAAGLAEIAAAGGQLGVPIDKLDQFVVLAAKVATAFNISAEEAGQAVAKLANVFDLPLAGVEQLGDSINVLGNSTAATEAQLLQFLVRVGGSAKTFGLSAEATAALGAALISLGKPPEIAANAVNKLLTVLQAANVQSSQTQAALDAIGLSAGDLAARIRENPQAALEQFLVTLQQLDGQARAEAIAQILGTEYNDDISLLVNSLGQYRGALESVNDQQKIAGSLQREADKQAEQTKAQYQQLKNVLNDIVLEFGNAFLPTVKAGIAVGKSLAESIGDIVALAPGLTGLAGAAASSGVALGGIKLATAAAQVALSGMIGTLAGTAVSLSTYIKGADGAAAATSRLGAAMSALFKVVGSGVAGKAIGDYLYDQFEVVRKAGLVVTQALILGTENIRYAWESMKAVVTDDTLDAAEQRHQERLAVIDRLLQEQTEHAKQAGYNLKAGAEQAAPAQDKLAAATAQATTQVTAFAGATTEASESLDRLSASALADQLRAIRDSTIELQHELRASNDEIARLEGLIAALSAQDLPLGDLPAQLEAATAKSSALSAKFEALSDQTDSLRNEQFKQLGIDVGEVLTGIDEKAGELLTTFESLASDPSVNPKLLTAAYKELLAELDSPAELTALKQSLQDVRTEGFDAAGAVAEIEKKLQEVEAAADPAGQAVAEAFEAFGIKTRAELEAAADLAVKNFEIVRSSGVASATELDKAFKQLADAQIAAAEASGKASAESKLGFIAATAATEDQKRAVIELIEKYNLKGETARRVHAEMKGSIGDVTAELERELTAIDAVDAAYQRRTRAAAGGVDAGGASGGGSAGGQQLQVTDIDPRYAQLSSEQQAKVDKIFQERLQQYLYATQNTPSFAGTAERLLRDAVTSEINRQLRGDSDNGSLPGPRAKSADTSSSTTPVQPVKTVRIEVGSKSFDVLEGQEDVVEQLLRDLAQSKAVSL